jgi:hypothetical protein
MDWEKYSAIAGVFSFPILLLSVLIQILDRRERKSMKEALPNSAPQSQPLKRAERFLRWKYWKSISVIAFFIFIFSILIWGINSNMRAKKDESKVLQYSNQVSSIESNIEEPTEDSTNYLSDESTINMSQPGESQQLHVGQFLQANFAKMSFYVQSISKHEPMAGIDVSALGETTSHQVFPGNYCLYTNQGYVAQVTKIDAGVSLNIEIYKQGHDIIPFAVSDPSLQWYFKLDNIQCDPPVQSTRVIRPFRIQADINGQSYSFPTGLIFYWGLTSDFDSIDSVPLQPEPDKYDITFLIMSYENRFIFNTPSNVVKKDGKTDIYKIGELPIKATNFVSAPSVQGEKIKIVYEITTNP